MQYLHPVIFQSVIPDEPLASLLNLGNALCLPVEVQELIPNPTTTPVSSVRYFVIDCRPADHYNHGHLSTAFHLDCDLMLQDKAAFEIAVSGLLTAQKQSIEVNSVAGGNHLCLIGSGCVQLDQTMLMVTAWFLQKHHKFVSMASGGFDLLHSLLMRSGESGQRYLVDHTKSKCPYCTRTFNLQGSGSRSPVSASGSDGAESTSSSLFDKLTSVVKARSSEMKEKFTEYINSQGQIDPFRGMTLLDTDEDDDLGMLVSAHAWKFY